MNDLYKDVKLPDGMSPDVLSHLMQPKNYGKLDGASGVGVGLDEKTQEYVIFYTLLDGDIIKDIRYATNGCQDTVVIGSMYTEMVKGNDLEYAEGAIQKMNDKLGEMTPQQRICADIVFTAFVASIRNFENLQNGDEEEVHILKMKDSCNAENMDKQDG